MRHRIRKVSFTNISAYCDTALVKWNELKKNISIMNISPILDDVNDT